MIRRLFYFSLGALAAVWTMRRLRSLRPEHVARRALTSATGTAVSLREFAAQVRREAAVRETELRAQYGLTSLEGPDPRPGHAPGGETQSPAGPHRPAAPDITVTRVASASRRVRAALPAGPGDHRHHHRRHHHRHDEKDGR